MIVAMRRLNLREARPAVGRFPKLQIGNVDRLAVTGIGEDVRVVPGPVHQIAMRRNQHPAFTIILRPVETGFFRLGLHQRPDSSGAGGRHRNPELAERTGWQARITRNLRPALAAVCGTKKAASRPAARNVPEVAAGLLERRKQDARIARIHCQIDGAGIGVLVQHFAPGLSTVTRLENPALLVCTECIAERGDMDEIGIVRMDADAADEPRLT